MGRKKKINDMEVADLFDQGFNKSDLAERFGVSRSTIHNAIRRARANLPSVAVPFDPEVFKKKELEVTVRARARLAAILDDMMGNIKLQNPTTTMIKQMVDALATLNKEERLMRGESTENVAVQKVVYNKLDPETKKLLDNFEKQAHELQYNEALERYEEEKEEGGIY